ncbi:MAG: alpha-amylase family protein [Actinomycetota bacterium]|nr:alpha-amylase family protein [Actinomycetota bacterium]
MSRHPHRTLPETTSTAVRAALAGLPEHLRRTFERRVERWLPDLRAGVEDVYADPDRVVERLLVVAAQRFAERPADLHDLDERRVLTPDWFEAPDTLGYATYVDRYAGTLTGVGERLDHLRELGVTYLHLLPLLQPRPAPHDGGYAVQDYRSVREDLGTMDDLRALTARMREQGMSLCLDLVLNHVAREHEWAERARAGDAVHRDFFLVHPDRSEPDRWEETLPEVFPDFAPGNFTWDEDLQGWVWTTFNSWQWDLNWANPAVLEEFADIICDLANSGCEVFRLDAIAFMWKRMGTDCQNQPEVHALTQALRAVARIACPAVIFLAEAIVGPRDLLAYLGEGERHGKVSDLAYHNALMVHLWSMLASGDTRLSSQALAALPTPPSSTSWICYARCHDDIGWAISDEDAHAAGLDGAAHRRFLADWYDGTFPGSWARGLVFQFNPATGDKRTSGSLASLAGLEAGDPLATERIELLHAAIMGFGGVPVIWMGDEVGLLNDPTWDEEPEHADDNRWVHRPRMPWVEGEHRPPDPHGLLPRLEHLVSVRAATPHLHAATPAEVLTDAPDGVLAVLRRHPHGPFLGLYNMTATPRSVPRSLLDRVGHPAPSYDRLAPQQDLPAHGDVPLAAYQARWLTA